MDAEMKPILLLLMIPLFFAAGCGGDKDVINEPQANPNAKSGAESKAVLYEERTFKVNAKALANQPAEFNRSVRADLPSPPGTVGTLYYAEMHLIEDGNLIVSFSKEPAELSFSVVLLDDENQEVKPLTRLPANPKDPAMVDFSLPVSDLDQNSTLALRIHGPSLNAKKMARLKYSQFMVNVEALKKTPKEKKRIFPDATITETRLVENGRLVFQFDDELENTEFRITTLTTDGKDKEPVQRDSALNAKTNVRFSIPLAEVPKHGGFGFGVFKPAE